MSPEMSNAAEISNRGGRTRPRQPSMVSVESLPSRRGSFASMASSDGLSDVSGLSRGNPGLGGADDPALTPTSPSGTARRMNRRVTRALNGSHHGLGGPRRMVFLDKPKEISHGRLAFISEIFKIKGTIVLKVVPQIILAAFVGLFANLVKVLYCGEGVASNDE